MKRESLLQSMRFSFSDWEAMWKISWDLFNFSLFVWAQCHQLCCRGVNFLFFFFLFFICTSQYEGKTQTFRRSRLPLSDATSELWVCVCGRGSEHLIRCVKVPGVTSAGGTTSWRKRQQKEKIRLQTWKKVTCQTPHMQNMMLSVMPAQQHNPLHQHKTQTNGRHVISMQNVGDKEDEEHMGGSRCDETHYNNPKCKVAKGVKVLNPLQLDRWEGKKNHNCDIVVLICKHRNDEIINGGGKKNINQETLMLCGWTGCEHRRDEINEHLNSILWR